MLTNRAIEDAKVYSYLRCVVVANGLNISGEPIQYRQNFATLDDVPSIRSVMMGLVLQGLALLRLSMKVRKYLPRSILERTVPYSKGPIGCH